MKMRAFPNCCNNPRLASGFMEHRLHYIKTDSGEVIAIDPQTGAQKGVIKVGGKPTALALNLATNTVAVLDASHKTVHEIDGALTTVQSSTSVDVDGTPTTLQVDTKGNVAVGIAGAASGGPATSAQGVGFIATIDGGSKQVESVRQVDIAPSGLVLEGPVRTVFCGEIDLPDAAERRRSGH